MKVFSFTCIIITLGGYVWSATHKPIFFADTTDKSVKSAPYTMQNAFINISDNGGNDYFYGRAPSIDFIDKKFILSENPSLTFRSKKQEITIETQQFVLDLADRIGWSNRPSVLNFEEYTTKAKYVRFSFNQSNNIIIEGKSVQTLLHE